jgi:FkbM family methyltransferase
LNLRDLTYIARKLTQGKNVAGMVQLLGRIRNPAALVAIVRGGKAAQLRLRFAGRTLLFNDVNLEDLANLYEIFGKEIYKTERDATTILDLGAYHGFYATYAYAKYPRATIYAFEPFAENYRQLSANAELNGLSPDRLKLFNVAVSARSGTVDFFAASDGAMLHSMVFETATKVRVPATTVSDIMTKEGLATIDVLKIDVEGEEFAIFGAMDDATFARIDTIVAEMHTVPGKPISGFVDHLASKAFTLESIDKPGQIYRFDRSA